MHRNFGGIRLAVFSDLNASKFVAAVASSEIGSGVRTHDEGTHVTVRRNHVSNRTSSFDEGMKMSVWSDIPKMLSIDPGSRALTMEIIVA